ncbi:YwaF family protein [Candidatus Viridilinea mediisalina]|uniref:TIGR02206 family membrane protein n=1 Tax=Candidatus Viridilinea mediisalina TaxID=2024553 RepID=A0A2A6RF83_9CHLR|nr:TIGR02206 family membrane protein [Candidatus Viridilinea mediisalina]PDW01784.1 TIGR02206 family membrane protein [Candidatus Viridilinea mediisalina]
MFSLTYDGPPFRLFSSEHILALVAVALVCLLVALITPRLSPRGQQGLRWSIASFALANTIAWDLWQRAHGVWHIAYSLPLHLCTLSVLLAAILLATRNYRLFELLYFWGFAGATQALLTPDLQASGHNFPHFVYLIFWTSHGVILWAVIFAMAAWGYRPTWRSFPRVALSTNLILIPIGLTNWLTGGNYMFLARKPDYATLLDVMGPWPWYIIPLQLIGLIICVLVYLPIAFYDFKRP